MTPPADCYAIVLAGGRGTRFGGAEPKQLRALAGRPVLAHALDALLAPAAVAGAVVPCAPDLAPRIAAEVLPGLASPKPVRLVDGGPRRMDSVRAGLAALPPEATWVMIHDGARPNPGPGLLARLLAARDRGDAWLPVLPVTDTLKRVDAAGRVRATVDRAPLRRAQTPQLFRAALIRRAHARGGDEATDDAQLIERLGEPVGCVAGEPGNIKLTLPADEGVLEYWMAAGR